MLCLDHARNITWVKWCDTRNTPLGEAIPEDSRPKKEQPYYHLLAENDQSYYVAYVSEQNLVVDYSGEPVDHPDIPDLFGPFQNGTYSLHFQLN